MSAPLTAAQAAAVLAGLRLLQHFNDGTLIVTNRRCGVASHSRMDDIADIRDDAGEGLGNEEIDTLCAAVNDGTAVPSAAASERALRQWIVHLEAFIGAGAMPGLRASFANGRPPGGACNSLADYEALFREARA